MSHTEPMHTLTIAVESGSLIPEFHCPHDGATFTIADAPDCRRFSGDDPLTRISETCLADENWEAWGVDCLQVDGPIFKASVYPIPVRYWWDGEDFYVSPAAVPAPGQEG